MEYPPGKENSRRHTLKAEVETKARDLIEKVLKPKYVKPPKKGKQFNYITDIEAKWSRNNFYFSSTYACPSPDASSPTFEAEFARMEPLGDGTFALYAMRYTGNEWVSYTVGRSPKGPCAENVKPV